MMGNAGEKDCRQDIKARLRRIEGQVRGIYRMVDEGASAAGSLPRGSGFRWGFGLSNYLANCLGDDWLGRACRKPGKVLGAFEEWS